MLAPDKSSDVQPHRLDRKTYLKRMWSHHKRVERELGVAAHPAMVANRRGERRSVIWTDATLGLGLFGKRVCDVHDLSVNGARLVLRNPCKLPKRFSLTVNNGSSGPLTQRRCRLRWQDGDQAGVVFEY